MGRLILSAVGLRLAYSYGFRRGQRESDTYFRGVMV